MFEKILQAQMLPPRNCLEEKTLWLYVVQCWCTPSQIRRGVTDYYIFAIVYTILGFLLYTGGVGLEVAGYGILFSFKGWG